MQVVRGIIDKQTGQITDREEHIFDSDECNRPDTTLEGLSALKPYFDQNSGQGTVTTGNASQLADGASATLLMEGSRAEALGIRPLVAMGKVVAVHRAPAAAGTVEIELEGATPFPVRDALPVLRIGDKTFRLSRFPNRSSTFTIAFAMSRADFDTLPQGAEVVVESGAERWGFGKLDKRLAQ